MGDKRGGEMPKRQRKWQREWRRGSRLTANIIKLIMNKPSSSSSIKSSIFCIWKQLGNGNAVATPSFHQPNPTQAIPLAPHHRWLKVCWKVNTGALVFDQTKMQFAVKRVAKVSLNYSAIQDEFFNCGIIFGMSRKTKGIYTETKYA